MKRMTAERWAECCRINKNDYENYLVKLGLQKSVTRTNSHRVWELTRKGKKYGRYSWKTLFRKIEWDIDANFEVMKLHGKRTGKYYYCDQCNAYLLIQNGFEVGKTHWWECKRCGHLNQTSNVL